MLLINIATTLSTGNWQATFESFGIYTL